MNPEKHISMRFWRVCVLLVPLLLSATLAATMWSLYPNDWGVASEAGKLMMSGNLRLYADMPEAQMGPLAILLAGVLPRAVYISLVCALMPLLLWLIISHRRPSQRLYLCTLSGGVLLAWPWTALGIMGHVDDALVILGAIGLAVAIERNRTVWICLAFLIAIAAKPTVVVLLPLVFLSSRRAGLFAVLGAGAIWAPWVLADLPGFLASAQGIAYVWPGSLQSLLGVEDGSAFPVWVRPAQLAGGLLLCWFFGRRGSPAAAVTAVFAFRAMLEPGAFDYYSTSVMAVALMFDSRRSRVPAVTGVAFLSFLAAFDFSVSPTQGVVRLAMLALVFFLVARTRSSDTVSEAEPTGAGRTQLVERNAQLEA